MFDCISLHLKVQQRIALFLCLVKKKNNSVYERHNNITGSTAVNLRGNPTVF